MLLAHFLLFIFSIVLLTRSSTYLIRTLTQLAVKFKLSQFIVAFILMSVATSLPELMVGISSSFSGETELALGTVLGSNIANLTLIIGLPALIANGLRVESRVRNKDVFNSMVLSLIPLIMLLDGSLARAEGAILVILFVLYIFRLYSQRESYTKKINAYKPKKPLIYYLSLFTFELLVMIVAAYFVVQSSSFIAVDLNFPVVLVGLVIVALGTSLPELSFELYAIKKRESGLALGNVLGSVVANSCLVLGLTALVSPIQLVEYSVFYVSAMAWLVVVALFVYFLRSQYKLTWQEGLVLVFIYALFLIFEFSLQPGLALF